MAYKMVGLIKRNFTTKLDIDRYVVYKNLNHNWTIVIVCGHHMGSLIFKPCRKYKRKQVKYHPKLVI